MNLENTSLHKKCPKKGCQSNHLIPYNTIIQKYFDKTLDSKINLFVLCPECHRKIHHSNINVQKEMIRILIKFSQAIETVYNIKNIDDIVKLYRESLKQI